MSTDIHPTAIVDPQAELGENVYIGPYCVIESGVGIGDDCHLEPFVHVKANTSLGKNNQIHSYACLGGKPQDFKFQGETTWLEIGDNNSIREYVTINIGTAGGGKVTKVGSNCLIMAYSHIAHDCMIGDNVVLANAATLAGHIVVEDYAVVGGLSAVHQFVRIGRYAYIGGMTGVPQDVPPYMLIAGERGWLHGLNLIGLRRQGFSNDQLNSLKRAFKTIWRSDLSRQNALEKLEQEDSTAEVKKLVEFIKSSERGVISTRA
ncbi:MAG: acyl-ACP--UDP-N-acetylglucosamine O-acyltransferase [Thermodesulfobacteriota bacterium]